jgi:hypothetical protein
MWQHLSSMVEGDGDYTAYSINENVMIIYMVYVRWAETITNASLYCQKLICYISFWAKWGQTSHTKMNDQNLCLFMVIR